MKKGLLFLFISLVATTTVVFLFDRQSSAQMDAADIQCANRAATNLGPAGFGRFPFSVDLYPGQTAITTFRTYVCNGSDATIRDWTFTSASSMVVETGRTNVLDYGPTGWSGPSGGFYMQDMGTFAPHEWRKRDVNMGVRESAFDGPGTYTIRVSGHARIWDSSFGCFYPDPTCYGETNTIQINLSLTVNRPDITCAGITSTPSVPGLGQAFTVRSNYSATDNSINSNYRLDAFLRNPAGTVVAGGNDVPYTVINPNSLQYTFPVWTDPGPGGTYSVTTTLRIPSAAWFDPVVCNFSFVVADKPYHKVFGGDVIAGAGIGSSCINSAASIIGRHGEGPILNAGAGSQLAAMALNLVVAFASGQLRASSDYDHITFANGTPLGILYGGSLNQNHATCAADYWAGAPASATGLPGVINPGGGSRTFRVNSDITLTSANSGVGAGDHLTIYVNGNVYIQDPINYQSTNYNSINDIPSFRLIVRNGNIYVGAGAHTLNGLYVAIPTNDTNGRFYTCAREFLPPDQNLLDNGCRTNNLTVYGAVIAELIKFTRTTGSLRFSCSSERYNTLCPSNQPAAERFIYTPETWLTSDFNNDSGTNDSLQTLPPVL